MQNYRYDGVLVAEHHDEFGPMEVVDNNGMRCLHFGTAANQSSMALSLPRQLIAQYERVMSSLLLVNAEPSRVLLLGLGGGCMARFLLQHNDNVQVQAVELRSAVVDIARQYFALPHDPRLQITIGCGARYVAQHSEAEAGRYDLLVVDAYQGDGMATEVASEQFFADCYRLLATRGVLVINVWRTNAVLLAAITRSLVRIFNSRVHFVPVGTSGNLIGFAFPAQFAPLPLQQAERQAQQLKQRYWFDYQQYLQDLRVSDPMNSLFIDD